MKKAVSGQKEKKARLEFISSLEQEFREQLEELLRQKNEFLYQKREKELMLEEQKNMENPNISMFSPLADMDDGTTNSELYRREIEELEKKIQETTSFCDAMVKKIVALQDLKEFVAEEE